MTLSFRRQNVFVSWYDKMPSGKIEPLPVLYTPDEVAESAKVSRRTVYRWIKSGFLPARKVGVGEAWTIAHSDVVALLSGRLRGKKTGDPLPVSEAKTAPSPSNGRKSTGRRA